MKTLLKWLVVSLAGVFALVLGAVLLILAFPQLLLNDRMMIVGAHLAGRAGVHLSWGQGHIQVESPRFLEKRVRLNFDDLCVRIVSIGLDACFAQARIGAAGGIAGLKPKVTEIGPVDLLGGRVTYSPPERKEESSSGRAFAIPEFLTDARLEAIHLEVLDGKILSQGRLLVATTLVLEGHAGPAGEPQVSFQGDGRLGGGEHLSVSGHVRPRPGGAGLLDVLYELKGNYAKRAARVSVDVSGQLSPDRLWAKITGSAKDLLPESSRLSVLGQARVTGCEIRLDRLASEQRPGALRVNCPLQAELRTTQRRHLPIELPPSAGVRVTADLRSSDFPPEPSSTVDGKVGVELEPIMTSMLQGQGKVESQVSGVPQDFPSGWRMDTDLGLRLDITKFEQLVRNLTPTPLDVWAPLRPLKGQVKIAVQGKFESSSGAAPLRVSTRLASQTQKLDLDAQGRLELLHLWPKPRVHLVGDVTLADVELELPPLPELPSPAQPAPDPIPQLLPDSRIRVRGQQQAGISEPTFTYELTLHTLDDAHPIRLLTAQAKAPIPLAIHLNAASDSAPTGQIKILGFPLELFKRDVKLEHLTVSLADPSKESKLDGKIVVPYTDYTISVLILGTADRPQIRFLSDPPLPDDQIIAVLIFGKPIDALDPDQQQSVGNSRAALSRGVLSLASLYYLSALNVESIDYDPDTRTASISYRLAEGTSLNMSQGTGGGQPSVGIRRRLSKHLAITTTLNNPSAQQTSRTVSTYLEWAYQY